MTYTIDHHPYSSLPDLTGGACLEPGAEIDAFHPRKMGAKQQEAYAVSLCKTKCPAAVRERCLADALDYERKVGRSHGIWGGLNEHERAALLKKNKKKAS